MRKTFTKLASAALAFTMIAASAIPTFAYDKTPEECTHHYYTTATIESDHLHETCVYCGNTIDEYFTKDPSECSHDNTKNFNAVRATCQHTGYTGDDICKDCGTITYHGEELPMTEHASEDEDVISEDPGTCEKDGYRTAKCIMCGQIYTKVYKATGHNWTDWKVVKEPTKTEDGERTSTCVYCRTVRTEVIPKLGGEETPSTGKKDDTTTVVKPTKPTTTVAKVGTKFVVSGQTYKVTKAGKEVSFIAAKKNAKSVSIPATVKSKGITYKVTSIAAKAVKSNKKAKSITVGANVSKIASNAFYKCPNVKTITIKSTKLTKKTASKKMVNGLNKKLVVKVPKKVKKSYAKIFKGLKIK